MNAYFCDAGEIDVVVEIIDYYGRTEPVRVCDLIFAETRGKAKARLLPRCQRMAEYTDIKARLIGKNVKREAGFSNSDDVWWDEV